MLKKPTHWLWRLCSILSHVWQNVLLIACLHAAWSLCSSSDQPATEEWESEALLQLIVSSRCFDHSVSFCICKGSGWGRVGSCPYISFASLISPLESSCFWPQMSDQALLVSPSTSFTSSVTMSWSEPYRGHLWGQGVQKNRKRWWRFSLF